MNSSGVGPSGAPRSNGGQGPYRRFPQQSRTRSQSPPGSSTYSSAPYSGPSRRFEQSSPPKRAWGAASRDSRDLPPPSTLDIPPYDRDGPYRGQRGGPWSERRPNGIVGPPSSAYQHDRFPRSERDARGRTEDQPDRRPLDNGWPRYNKSHRYVSYVLTSF